MEITFLGHAGFLISTGKIKIAIDPYLTDNPAAVNRPDEITADYILVTHVHADHLGDAFKIAEKSQCTIVGITELTRYASNQGFKAHGMNIGGSYDFGDFAATLTPAIHSNSLQGWPPTYMGLAAGFILTMEGKRIYHAGDTALFSDMELLGKKTVDLALLPIGDNYTMGPDDALEAIKLIRPKAAIPMHYNTWPVIKQDGENFKANVEGETATRVKLLKPGESYNL